MNPGAIAVAVLEALWASLGPALVADVEAWVAGKKGAAPSLADEEKAVEGAADAAAKAELGG